MNSRRLGTCGVCALTVCEECGNVQHSQGQTKVVHDSCLKDGADGTFSMIKFVR